MSNESNNQEFIYALDIGTRSIIGVVGRVEDSRFHVLAIEKEEHSKRTMLDGQIEDIAQVSQVVSSVTKRLEERLHTTLTQVCIAAAGRALHTERGRFELTLPAIRRIDHDLIGQLELGAVSDAETKLQESTSASALRLYLVGYTVSQYHLDHYPISTLLDHNGQHLAAEVVATFLPGEVVESLYSAMRMAGLEVASFTLEPIAALNAAIPAELRLLNLVLADIGAGTTDIAVCKDGSVVGYTMVTIAGDEITEAIMQAYLVDFFTAERLKAGLSGTEPLPFTDVLGVENQLDPSAVDNAVSAAVQKLASELSHQVLALNDGSPSALFLSGGGSKLNGLRGLVAAALDIAPQRVAIAGNNFKISAFSQEYDLNDPEYTTPLGIAISAGLELVSNSARVTLNGMPAKLFRNGSLTALDILMMNGYSYADLIGRSGLPLSVMIDGARTLYRGETSTPAILEINGTTAPHSTVIHTGDAISFTPAISGKSAEITFSQAVGGADIAAVSLLNGEPALPDQLLRTGDVILTRVSRSTQPNPLSGSQYEQAEDTPPPFSDEGEAAKMARTSPHMFILNDLPLTIPPKADGSPYYLMDMLERSGIDFSTLDREVILSVNGESVPFVHPLQDGDSIIIRYDASQERTPS
ncbi:MAG: ftsA [Firmicutes bacterium]|nr:ftsA [Bacillota bacterium]